MSLECLRKLVGTFPVPFELAVFSDDRLAFSTTCIPVVAEDVESSVVCN